MIWLLALMTSPLFAQVDLSAIQKLDEELPSYTDYKQSDEEISFQRQNRKFRPPVKKVTLEEIIKSGVGYGAIKPESTIRNLENNQNYKTQRLMYIKFFKLQDEFGFKYILNKDGSTSWRVRYENIESIEEELVLYERPMRYTPAPQNIARIVYDKKLTIPPEFSFYTGHVRGDFIADLFEDKKARSGMSNQYGIHFFTQWNLPIKAGAVLHYEKASYSLNGGGQVVYSSISLGPQIKTRDFDILSQPIRFQAHFRIGPFARAEAETIYGNGSFKFNSSDFLVSIERPIKNRLGEFVFGLYGQSQWLNIKDQTVPVKLKASNESNKSFGLQFAQVFE
jgi:hypothetical protein